MTVISCHDDIYFSYYGCNFEAALKWTKEFDSSRITHYESARYRNYDVIYDYSNLDLYL